MKKLLFALLITALLLVILGCQNTPEPSPPASVSPSPSPTETSFAPDIVLKYQITEKEEHPQGVCLQAFKEKVEELSGGKIVVVPYYSSIMFNTEEQTEALTEGQLEMNNVSLYFDLNSRLPNANMYISPCVFFSYEHLERFFSSNAVKKFYSQVSEVFNFTPLAMMTDWSRNINTVKTEPIVNPENLKGTKLRMPGGDRWIHIGKSLGTEDIVNVAYTELYNALKTGFADAHDNTSANTIDMRFYEVTKQVSLTRHYFDIDLVCVSNSIWDQMTEQQKQWMYEAAAYAAKQANSYAIRRRTPISLSCETMAL